MTDREILLDLLKRADIAYSVDEQDTYQDILVEAQSRNVEGYLGFYVRFKFENDRLDKMGVFE